jgi:DNA-binding HxlR family transcriptional regulator
MEEVFEAINEAMSTARRMTEEIFSIRLIPFRQAENADGTKLTTIDQMVLRELRKAQVMSFREIFYATKKDESTLHKRLSHLQKNGLVERADWGKYRLTPLGDEVSRALNEVTKHTTLLLSLTFKRKQG